MSSSLFTHYFPPILILCLGFVAAFGVADTAHKRERSEARLALSKIGEERIREFGKSLATTIDVARSIGAFFNASEKVERGEFQSFTRPFLKAHPEIQALEWVPLVTGDERARHESETRKHWRPDYCIREPAIRKKAGVVELVAAGKRTEYFPVHYVEPLEGNERAVGYDLRSSAARRRTLESAAGSGRTLVTGRIRLVQDGKEKESYSVLVCQPVYRKGESPSTAGQRRVEPRHVEPRHVEQPPRQRRTALSGFAVSVVRVDDLVWASLLRETDDAPKIAVRLLDESATPDQRLLYQSTGGRRLADEEHLINNVVRVGDRQWRVLYHPATGSLRETGGQQFWFLLVAGFVLSTLISAYLIALRSHSDTVERVVKRRTHQLEEAKGTLEQRNRDIESFYHTVSHELKTPLTCINQSVSILLENYAGPITEEQREFLNTARESVGQMSRCIDDLLDATRLETGKLSVTMRRTALAPVVRNVVRSMSLAVKERGLTVSAELPDNLPAVQIDEDRIAQVIRNLLSNALKFTPSGGEITIRGFLREGDTEVVWVSVADAGPGIPREQLERIFERHHQVRSEDSATHGGLGLGLSICREIVRLHGGHIRAESEPGEGATFAFSMRRAGGEESVEVADGAAEARLLS